jgi:hypothetical protein
VNSNVCIAEKMNKLKTSVQVAQTKIHGLHEEARRWATLKERLREYTAKSCQGVGDVFSLLQQLDHVLNAELTTSSHSLGRVAERSL